MDLLRERRDDSGFTFVELMVVIIIIGILAAIAIPLMYSQRNKAYGATANSDLRNAATMEESQFTDTGTYTANISDLITVGFKRSSGLTMGIGVSSSGYCEVASHDGTYWWYDSTAGGVQSVTTTSLSPPASASGVCAGHAPASLS